MKEQVVARTYPNTYILPMKALRDYLEKGYVVVMCNKFCCEDGIYGNEYILEKQERDDA